MLARRTGSKVSLEFIISSGDVTLQPLLLHRPFCSITYPCLYYQEKVPKLLTSWIIETFDPFPNIQELLKL